jgi:hypothetical protein
MVHGPDPFKDAIPSLPFHPLSQPHIMMAACPPLCPASLPTTTLSSPLCLLNRERRLFQNNSWTKWEAVQLADKLEAKQALDKAKWDLWKKADN